MTFSIRECRPEDYPGVAIVASLTRPEPFSAGELQDEDRRGRLAGTLHRLVAVDEAGTVAGYACAESFPWFPENRWELYVATHPERRGRGVGRALYEAAEQIALAGGAQSFVAWCRSTDPAYFAWAQRRGFVSDLLRTESVLDLSTFDSSRFAGVLDQVRAGGIRLELFDGPTPEAIVHGVWDVERLTGPDVPDYEPDAPFPTYEVYRQMWNEYTDPRLTVVALDGDRVVGVSTLFYSRTPGKGGYTGYTGVLREYRGRHIALAVKLLTVEGAMHRGVPRMRTNNDFENPSMLAVNTRLGYQLVPGPRRITKSW